MLSDYIFYEYWSNIFQNQVQPTTATSILGCLSLCNSASGGLIWQYIAWNIWKARAGSLGIHIFANQGIIFSLSVLFKMTMTMLKLPKKVVEDSWRINRFLHCESVVSEKTTNTANTQPLSDYSCVLNKMLDRIKWGGGAFKIKLAIFLNDETRKRMGINVFIFMS